MVKQTQTICRQIADELFECVWPFCEIGAKMVEGSKFEQTEIWMKNEEWKRQNFNLTLNFT